MRERERQKKSQARGEGAGGRFTCYFSSFSMNYLHFFNKLLE